MAIEKISEINKETIQELSPEELVDLKITLEEMLEQIDEFLEEHKMNEN